MVKMPHALELTLLQLIVGWYQSIRLDTTSYN